MSSTAGLHPFAPEGPVAIVCLCDGRPQLLRHPADSRVVGFAEADDAFRFAVQLELAGEGCTGTVAAPAGEQLHMVTAGTATLDLLTRNAEAA